MSVHIISWRGPELQARVEKAAKSGIDKVMSRCVNTAKQRHPWHNVTGTAEGSIRLEPAKSEAGRVVGRWGSFDVDYFIFLETGTSRMHARPSLRPAADAHYHELAGLIKAAF